MPIYADNPDLDADLQADAAKLEAQGQNPGPTLSYLEEVLQPCPFCGSSKLRRSFAMAQVDCYECGVRGPANDHTGSKWNSLASKVADTRVFLIEMSNADSFSMRSSSYNDGQLDIIRKVWERR